MTGQMDSVSKLSFFMALWQPRYFPFPCRRYCWMSWMDMVVSHAHYSNSYPSTGIMNSLHCRHDHVVAGVETRHPRVLGIYPNGYFCLILLQTRLVGFPGRTEGMLILSSREDADTPCRTGRLNEYFAYLDEMGNDHFIHLKRLSDRRPVYSRKKKEREPTWNNTLAKRRVNSTCRRNSPP
jgi:hypothetical protein